MKLLALDTSTDACSAAVYDHGDVNERFEVAPRLHAKLLLSMIESVTADAGVKLGELDAIAFGRGPGSFTGVRIAASTAQGLGMGAGLPLVAVSSLRALAQSAFDAHGVKRCAAAFDARMDEVYFGAFEIDAGGIARPVCGERVCAPEAVPGLEGEGFSGAGSGWGACGARLGAALGGAVSRIWPELYPRAKDLAVLGADGFRLGEAVAVESALPVYLRDRVTGS